MQCDGVHAATGFHWATHIGALADIFSEMISWCSCPSMVNARIKGKMRTLLDHAERERDDYYYDHAAWFFGAGEQPGGPVIGSATTLLVFTLGPAGGRDYRHCRCAIVCSAGYLDRTQNRSTR